MPLFQRLQSSEREYRPLLLIGFGGVLFALGNSVMWFILPILAEKLFQDLFLVGILIAIPSIIAVFCNIPAGGFSDHFGRKKFFISGLFLMAVLGLLLPSVNSLSRFIAFMFLAGLANVSIVVPARAYIMDIAPKKKTSEFFGIFEVFYQIGFTVGPVIAGYLVAGQLDLGALNSGLFYFLACMAAILILLLCKETVPLGKSALVSVKDVIQKDRLFFKSLLDFKTLHYAGIVVLLATFIIVFVDGVVWTWVPLYVTLGFGVEFVGVLLMLFVLPFILFEVPAGVLADRLGKVRVFVCGLLVAGVFLFVFGSSGDASVLLASAFLATTGLAFARPAIDGFLTDISASKERGGIVGVWNVAEDAGYVLGPVVGGLLAEVFSISLVFAFTGVLLIVSLPVVWLAVKKSGF
jgi:MFS family permease